MHINNKNVFLSSVTVFIENSSDPDECIILCFPCLAKYSNKGNKALIAMKMLIVAIR